MAGRIREFTPFPRVFSKIEHYNATGIRTHFVQFCRLAFSPLQHEENRRLVLKERNMYSLTCLKDAEKRKRISIQILLKEDIFMNHFLFN